MLIQNEAIFFRALESSDLEMLYHCENDTNVWRVSNTITPYSKDVLSLYLENAYQDIYTTKQLRLVVCDVNSREALGTIDLFDFEPTHQRVGVGILIFEKHRNKGFAKHSITLLKDYLANVLFLNLMFCNISVSNTESISLFESCGFKQIGIKKQWNKIGKNQFEDELMYQFNFE